MLIENIQDFNGKPVVVNGNRMTNHMSFDRIGNHLRVFLEGPNKIAVREYPG